MLSNSNLQKILIVGPAWIGDMVMAQSLFKFIKQQHSHVIIDVLAPQWSRPLLDRMPEINEALEMPLSHGEFAFSTRVKLGKELRKKTYDQAVVLPNSWKSALIPYFSSIPKRTGWIGEMRWGLLNDVRYLDKSKLPLMVQRFCALAIEAKQTLPEHLPYPKFSVKDS